MKTLFKIPADLCLVIPEEHVGCFMEIVAQASLARKVIEYVPPSNYMFKLVVDADPDSKPEVCFVHDFEILSDELPKETPEEMYGDPE